MGLQLLYCLRVLVADISLKIYWINVGPRSRTGAELGQTGPHIISDQTTTHKFLSQNTVSHDEILNDNKEKVW